MKRHQLNMIFAVATSAIVVAMSQVSLAQPGEGRGDRRGPEGRAFGSGPLSSVRLAATDEVAAALKLTDEQSDQIAKINQQLREDVRAAFDGGGGREKMRELYGEAAAKLAEILDDAQEKRLMGIVIQVNGANATNDPAVAKELNITDDQKANLAEVRDGIMQAMREAFDEIRGQDLSRDEMRTKFEQLRDDADKKVLAVLTDEQQAQLEALKGEPVEIDMSQFRPGGGRGFGGPRGEGRRERGGDRGRPDSGESGKSDASDNN